MSKIYMAVTVCQDRNESIFKPRENAEYSPGYYSYVLPCKAGDNIKFVLDCIGGLQVAHLCSTKKRRRSWWKHGTPDTRPTGNICLIPRRFEEVTPA